MTGHNKGFTLVELSIVLVIIGLVVAGVVFGRDLVENFKIGKLAAEFTEYEAAFNTFRLKYGEVPGDTNKASVFFDGAQNGNANNLISGGESQLAIEHMGAAGLIDWGGGYTSGALIDVGVNMPASSWSERHTIVALSITTPNSTFRVRPGIHFSLRPERDPLNANLSYYSYHGPSGEQSRQLDLKLDDGMPYTGKMRGHGHSYCTVSATGMYQSVEIFPGGVMASCTPMWFVGTF